ncbi:hypothetical protein SALBM311S_10470 [Streptomyces alboniger]
MSLQTSPQPADLKPAPEPFLDVRDLRVRFPTEDGVVKSINGVSLTLEKGRTLGIVGESGSGKSVTSLALLGLHKGTRAQVSGEIGLEGRELVALPEHEMRGLRGRTVSMIFQDPLSALHPYFTVGAQIAEAYQVHHKVPRKEARDRAVEMLKRVGIPQPERRAKDYPHQFSGGMRQRAMIAMALVCDPELLIADSHHRPGRHRPGADPGPDPRPPGGVRLRRHPHHARPRRGGRHRRRHPGDVRRPTHRVRHRPGRTQTPGTPLHLGPVGVDAADHR